MNCGKHLGAADQHKPTAKVLFLLKKQKGSPGGGCVPERVPELRLFVLAWFGNRLCKVTPGPAAGTGDKDGVGLTRHSRHLGKPVGLPGIRAEGALSNVCH